MKNAFCFLIFLIALVPGIKGQRLLQTDTTKYRINLPSYWGHGNKIWQLLTNKLPIVCEELKDKELCGDDCNPGYSIEFEMSAPVIYDYTYNHISADYTNNQYKKPTDTWDIVTNYGFECSLLLLDDKNKIITRLIVVDTDEVWTISNRVKLASYSSAPVPMSNIRRTAYSRSLPSDNYNPNFQVLTGTVGQEGQTPYSYINANKDKLWPSNKDLFFIVDIKINSW